MLSFESVIWYLFLLDSLIALLMAWFNGKWYKNNFRIFSRYFPLAKGWTSLYFLIVIWVGWLYMRLGILP